MTKPDLTMPLRDAVDVPVQVHADDFVLQLHRGVSAEDSTLRDYEVTPAIAECFDDGLGLVQSAVRSSASKGAFIHGSFGSGKSHFMAVMHLLLTGSIKARAKEGLQSSVAKYDAVLGMRFLAVDYHLLGKKSFEEALFSGYLQTVQELHPDKPQPVLHNSDAILADAGRLRVRLGDEEFFSGLGGSTAQAAAGWGKRATAYTADSYRHAAEQPPDSSDRQRLVRALVSSYFSSSVASGEWLEISQGLRAMTAHTKELGYDGLVLFLDELVLWLGQHLGDMTFIQTETSKVAKLVESEMGMLPVPLISFVARQRELKDFLGGSGVGAEQVSLGQSFQWWEDRFDKLTLQATDLPQIVHRRLLRPTSELGRVSLEAAVARVKANPSAWRYLLDDEIGSSEVDFAKVYPFSPALVDAMIALSSLMQRERTALKIMSELLADGRDELTVSDVIPVGDLFDVVVLGDAKPLTEDMKRRFQHAEAFYTRKLRPYLLNKHGLTDAAAAALPRNAAFRTEDRLAKTLLVAEIAPGAVSLKNLTAGKLAALNFGTVVSFVPGQEAQQVLGWVRNWAKEFGEVNIGAGTDPLISIQLAGVDYDSVLDNVRSEDTTPNRRRLVKDLLLQELGVTTSGGLLAENVLMHVWRGSKRSVDLVFGNIRDPLSLSDQALQAAPGRWKLVIDFPFDDSPEHGPNDDVVRMYEAGDRGIVSDTVAWVPHYLSTARVDDVGKLVMLDYVLTGDRFAANSEHLPLADREPAKMQLENQRKNLTEQIKTALRQAYGVQTPTEDNIGQHVSPGDTFVTLVPGFRPRTPQATSLVGGAHDVLGQALEQQFPDHPKFEPSDSEVTRTQLTWTLELVRRAASEGGRVEGVERHRANTIRRVTDALGLGQVRENVYALSAGSFTWWMKFTQWAADAGDSLSVKELRERLETFGMTSEVEDLLILAWAALADRQWVRHGTILPAPGIGALATDMTPRPAVLPDEALFATAMARGETVFGIRREHHRNAASVARLASALRERAQSMRAAVGDLVTELEKHAETLGLAGTPEGRLATARRGRDLVEGLLHEQDSTALVETLASFDLPAEPQPLAKSLASALAVVAGLRGSTWDLLDQLGTFEDNRDQPIRDALYAATRAEEAHSELLPALRAATQGVVDLLRKTTSPGKTPHQQEADDESRRPVLDPSWVDLVIEDDLEAHLGELTGKIRAAYVAKVPGKRFRVRWGWE